MRRDLHASRTPDPAPDISVTSTHPAPRTPQPGYDVVIAGAGPAGAIAALVLARANVRVVLLDRATFPRSKLCGDTVNPGALGILRRLGLGEVVRGGLPIAGMIVTGEPSTRVCGRYRDGTAGISLTRRVLDARLVEAAAAAGAQIKEDVLVRGPLVDGAGAVTGLDVLHGCGGAEQVHGRVVIAADGRFSRVARALRLSRGAPAPRRWALGGYFEGAAGLGNCGEMHVRAGRYIGVAPLPGDLANACLVTADRRALREPGALTAAIDSDSVLRGRFAHARLIEPPTLLGPLAVEARAAGMRGLLLAGDAAGFIDPMTGDGLRFAFRGGELAAMHALDALERGWNDAHVRLRAARAAEFGAKWRFNRALRALVGTPLSVRGAAATARIAPSVLRGVIRYAGDAGHAEG
jgi:flavin-dependent dehydrogenase